MPDTASLRGFASSLLVFESQVPMYLRSFLEINR